MYILHRGLFMLLFKNADASRLDNGYIPLRTLLRKLTLVPSGHYMVGSVNLMGERFGLSGAYGHDGLPIEITQTNRMNPPIKPERFETMEEHVQYYDQLAKCKWERVERAPGLWRRLHPLPDHLVADFWEGGGHNSSGVEGSALGAWATENEQTLRHMIKKPKSIPDQSIDEPWGMDNMWRLRKTMSNIKNDGQ